MKRSDSGWDGNFAAAKMMNIKMEEEEEEGE
jgi:hypothetical protein